MYGPVPGSQHPHPSGSAATEKPGIGLAIVLAGLVAGLLSLFALAWAEGGGESATFMDIRDTVSNAPDPTSVVPDAAWYYLSWAAFATFGVVAALALLAGVGLRSGATIAVRTLGVVAALAACGVHYVGVWQLFEYGGEAADAGPLTMYVGYGLMLVGSVAGPAKVAPPAPWAMAPAGAGYPSPGLPGSGAGPGAGPMQAGAPMRPAGPTAGLPSPHPAPTSGPIPTPGPATAPGTVPPPGTSPTAGPATAPATAPPPGPIAAPRAGTSPPVGPSQQGPGADASVPPAPPRGG